MQIEPPTPSQTKLIDLGCESAEIGINVKKNVDEKIKKTVKV